MFNALLYASKMVRDCLIACLSVTHPQRFNSGGFSLVALLNPHHRFLAFQHLS